MRNREHRSVSARSKTPSMHGNFTRENREVPSTPDTQLCAGRLEKDMIHVLFQGHKDERRGCQASCTEIAFCELGRAIEASTTARRYPAKDCWLSPRRIPGLGCRARMRAPATCAPQSSVHRAALGDNHRRPAFPSRKPTDLCSMQRSSQ